MPNMDKKEVHVTKATVTFEMHELAALLGREAMAAVSESRSQSSMNRGWSPPAGTTVKLRVVEATRDSGAYKTGEFTIYADVEIDHLPRAVAEKVPD